MVHCQVIFGRNPPLHPHIYSNGHICLGKPGQNGESLHNFLWGEWVETSQSLSSLSFLSIFYLLTSSLSLSEWPGILSGVQTFYTIPGPRRWQSALSAWALSQCCPALPWRSVTTFVCHSDRQCESRELSSLWSCRIWTLRAARN